MHIGPMLILDAIVIGIRACIICDMHILMHIVMHIVIHNVVHIGMRNVMFAHKT